MTFVLKKPKVRTSVLSHLLYLYELRSRSRYFKSPLIYIFSIPLAVWNSNSSIVDTSKQKNKNDFNAKSMAEHWELQGNEECKYL